MCTLISDWPSKDIHRQKLCRKIYTRQHMIRTDGAKLHSTCTITNTGKSCAENFTQDNIWYVRTVRNYIVHVLQIARSISKSIYVFLNFHQRRNECMHKWISWPCFDWHFLAGKRFVAWNTRLKSKNPTSDIRNENYLPCSSRSP